MKNKEKSEEIALKYAREYTVSRNDSHKQNILFKESSIIECEKSAMEMAEFKDEQFNMIIEKTIELFNKYPSNIGFSKDNVIEIFKTIKKAMEE